MLLEKKLGKGHSVWLVGNYVIELVLQSAFETAFGKSSSPNVGLFQRFCEKWACIDQQCYQHGLSDEHLKKHILSVLDDIISFATAQLSVKHPRDDYRELLELTIIFLGGSLSNGVVLKCPGAFHHARWMSKALYCYKIWLFPDHFKLTKEQEVGIRDICLFCILVYIKSWMTCSLPTEAPQQDLHLMKQLIDYKWISPAISKATSEKFSNHMW